MTRRSGRTNRDWETPAGQEFRWEHVSIEVLMDIRAELRQLNETLGCYRVRRGMDALHRLDKRAALHWKLTPGRKK